MLGHTVYTPKSLRLSPLLFHNIEEGLFVLFSGVWLFSVVVFCVIGVLFVF